MNDKPKLGFAGLGKIRPDSDPATQPITLRKPTDTEIDKVAERVGFESREPTRKLQKRPNTGEPTSNLALRPPVRIYNRFVQFSIDNRYSYPEALEALLDKAGVK